MNGQHEPNGHDFHLLTDSMGYTWPYQHSRYPPPPDINQFDAAAHAAFQVRVQSDGVPLNWRLPFYCSRVRKNVPKPAVLLEIYTSAVPAAARGSAVATKRKSTQHRHTLKSSLRSGAHANSLPLCRPICPSLPPSTASASATSSSTGVKSTARSRRENENVEFGRLAEMLPLPDAVASQLDKGSVVRLTSSFLALRELIPRDICRFDSDPTTAPSPRQPGEIRELASHCLQALDGFLLVLSANGRIAYISETASVCIGVSQVELTGNSLDDFVHADDRQQVRSLLQPPQRGCAEWQRVLAVNERVCEVERRFHIRMKCVLAKRNAGLTDHGYKVIHATGYLKLQRGATPNVLGLAAVGYTLPPSASTDLRLSAYSFMFRAALDLTLLYLEARAGQILGFELCSLQNRTLYTLIHPADAHDIAAAHRTALRRHQATTGYFRWLHGDAKVGWVWLHAQLVMVRAPKTSRPAYLLAVCHAISTVPRPQGESSCSSKQIQD